VFHTVFNIVTVKQFDYILLFMVTRKTTIFSHIYCS